MKKKKNGFAATGILYTILVIFLILMSTLLVTLSSRSRILSKLKSDAKNVPEKQISIGDRYEIDPGDGVTRTFYVLEVRDNNVSLIMDSNIDNNPVAWITKEDYIQAGGTEENWNNDKRNNNGPRTALAYLQSQTSGWNVEVSMPTGQQIANAGGITEWNGSNSTDQYTEKQLPDWLSENLYTDSNISLIHGYWTSTPNGLNFRSAWFVDSVSLHRNTVDVALYYGVRPVITILKSDLP